MKPEKYWSSNMNVPQGRIFLIENSKSRNTYSEDLWGQIVTQQEWNKEAVTSKRNTADGVGFMKNEIFMIPKFVFVSPP